jgi:hypothetical protein
MFLVLDVDWKLKSKRKLVPMTATFYILQKPYHKFWVLLPWRWLWRIAYSWLWRRVAFVTADIPEGLTASVIRMDRISELETADSFHLDDVGYTFLRNADFCKSHTASHPRRLDSSPYSNTCIFLLAVHYITLRLTAVGDPPRWPRDTPLCPQKSALYFVDKWLSLGRYSSLTD